MCTLSDGPALTVTEATPGIDSSLGRTVSSMKRRWRSIGPGEPGRSCTKNQDRVSLELSSPPSVTTGRSESRGSGCRRFIRLSTSISALRMSVPIEKRSVIAASPAFALPSSSSTPGSPCSTFSSGSRISDSISSGDAVDQAALIVICGRSMSGNNCSGRWLRLSSPSRPTNTTSTTIATGLRVDQFRDSMMSFWAWRRGETAHPRPSPASTVGDPTNCRRPG